ncbi:glycosyltransferase family 2 protein [Pseudonocardia sp. KRD291]|uniref:glycosyltransferase family 2 protein n=1 Tax=Pseudonocardia sp. KRD291 TaxID=2792007 RepID=UPI001C4A4B0E|nr:glycosyltransferase family 2 protein [Pseudonocardia sp. KRD291]MBW0101553.1 glycosyltransferase family 2 protein [Pseudonocardia sp. KRD291]
MTELPSIAFVVATLDEEPGIEACVRSLLQQRYPADRIEVAVADGGSTDRTTEIVSALAAADGRVRLLHNPRRIAASAFNIGIASTSGDVVSLVSAHSVTDPAYAVLLAEAFEESGAALVGGRMDAVAEAGATPMAQAIVRATSSPLGLGPARFHYSDRPGWVDTAFPGAYKRDLFDEIGGFDESLVRNQDDDLHLRARLAGHRMWFEPRLRSDYRPRPTLRRLWRQYHGYGRWRAATAVKHRRVASVRHLAPAALVAGLAAGPVALAAGGRMRPVAGTWAVGVVAWAGVLAVAAWREREHPRAVRVRVPAAVGCLHIAYGAGFWSGAAHHAGRALRCRPESAGG